MARREIELANHGGKDNGALPVTKDQFVEYGIHPRYVPSLRTLQALGFVICTERGRRAYADFSGTPNKFRVTNRHFDKTEPTNEWNQIDTFERAKTLAREARGVVSQEHSARAKRYHKTKSQVHTVHLEAGAESGPTFPGPQSGPTSPGTQSGAGMRKCGRKRASTISTSLPEMREALEAWNLRLRAIARPQSVEVITLPGVA